MAADSPTTAAATGSKRKRITEPKFYAVRVGYNPGVYGTWKECMEQIKGFKGATFKSFPTAIDAEKFVAGQNPSRPGDKFAHANKFYAVKVGRVPGIYTTWEAAQQQITKWKGPKHRCFSTRADAKAWLDEGTAGDPNVQAQDQFNVTVDPTEESPAPANPKRPKKTNAAAAPMPPGGGLKHGTFLSEDMLYDGYEPGCILPSRAEDGFDSNIIFNPSTGDVVFKTPSQRMATKVQATGMMQGGTLRIYTDGSSLRNGQKEGYAGVGVYFGPGDTRNLSETLLGPRQTNQRAELTAIIRALDLAPKDCNVAIITDSEYSINCATKWAEGWRRNGWKTANGKAVENKDLVESILSRVEERFALGSNTSFEWIKGHANHLGNVEADRLAVNAARSAANVPAGYRKVIK